MAVLSSSASDYLTQVAGGSVTLPDTTGDLTVFLWMRNVAPAVTTNYKTGLVLFTTDGDYTKPYLTIQVNQSGGYQTFVLLGGDGAVDYTATPVIVPIDTWQAFAFTYDATSHVLTAYAYLLDPIAGQTFSPQGTFTIDFSADTFASMSTLNDAAGADAGLAVAMYRQWSAKLSIGSLNEEAQGASAVLGTDLETQTPLILAADPSDLTSHANSWTVVGAPTTRLPGPLAITACQFMVMPEQTDTFFCDTQGNVLAANEPDAPPPIGTRLLYVGIGETVGMDVRAAVAVYNADTGAFVSELCDLGTGVTVTTISEANGRIYVGYGVTTLPGGAQFVGIYLPDGTLIHTIALDATKYAGVACIFAYSDDEIYVAPWLYDLAGVQLLEYDSAGTLLASWNSMPYVVGYLGGLLGLFVTEESGDRILYYTNTYGGTTPIRRWNLTADTAGTTFGPTLGFNARIRREENGTISSCVPFSVTFNSHYGVTTADGSAETTYATSGYWPFALSVKGYSTWILTDVGGLITKFPVQPSAPAADLTIDPAVHYPAYVPIVGAGFPNTNPMIVVGDDSPPPPPALVTLCPTRAGTAWGASDNTSTGLTDLYEFNVVTGAVLRVINLPVLIGDLAGAKSLMELPTGDLLTVNRSTHDLIRIAIPDGTVAHSYGITINPLDGALNSDGSRLIYTDSADLKLYDVENSQDLGVLFTPTAPSIWPVWLGDCSILLSEATYRTDGDLVRYTQAGAELFRYVYDHSTFAEGQLGLAADIGANRIWLLGDWDHGSASEQAATLLFTLAPGGSFELVPLAASASDPDVAAAATAVYLPITCTPMPPDPTTVTYPVRRLRRFLIAFDDNVYVFLSRLEIYLQAGIGTLATPDPQVMIRFSKDGGSTWGPLLTASAGKMGEYSRRVYWNRLGRGRQWTCELTVSDPVLWGLLEAFADVEKGTS